MGDRSTQGTITDVITTSASQQTRVDFAVSNQERLGTKEAEMKIVDSLLISKFFSLWRGAGEPLSFFSIKHIRPPYRERTLLSITWIHRTVDRSGTWRKRHAGVFS